MLLQAGLGGLDIQQEVPVQSLCPLHKNGRDRFDYYLPSLGVVVELHGEQHFKPVSFGGISKNAAKNNYVKRVKVDEQKAISARQAGYLYVVFRHNDLITLDEFTNRINIERAYQGRIPVEKVQPIKKVDEFKEKARLANKEYGKKLRQAEKEKKEKEKKLGKLLLYTQCEYIVEAQQMTRPSNLFNTVKKTT